MSATAHASAPTATDVESSDLKHHFLHQRSHAARVPGARTLAGPTTPHRLAATPKKWPTWAKCGTGWWCSWCPSTSDPRFHARKAQNPRRGRSIGYSLATSSPRTLLPPARTTATPVLPVAVCGEFLSPLLELRLFFGPSAPPPPPPPPPVLPLLLLLPPLLPVSERTPALLAAPVFGGRPERARDRKCHTSFGERGSGLVLASRNSLSIDWRWSSMEVPVKKSTQMILF
mmetsp:Transcript_7563/g.11493  ORF Transcript_7563/g.11493 Transcript_7563/m.11493 type:complete len:230 (+) Transcript_7563:543-1232(+)